MTARSAANDRICEFCGKEFRRRATGRIQRHFCSVDCAVVAKRTGQKPRMIAPKLAKNCLECGVFWTPLRVNSVLCSFACADTRERRRKIDLAKKTSDRSRQCPVCEVRFSALYFGNAARQTAFCSDECRIEKKRELAKKSSHEARVRARRFGVAYEPVDPLKVFVQHAWICRACGTFTHQSCGDSDPFEATLDHIIPMSRGGGHLYSNVQLLCRKCNVAKSDRTMEEFCFG